MNLKEKTINGIIEIEGGYVNNSDDSGGETKYGITKQVARENDYDGPVIDMPRELAFEIYSAKYWDKVMADDLLRLSERLAEEVVDTAVNTGPGQATYFLQRSLNVLNRGEKLYPDISPDWRMGKVTLAAVAAYLEKRSESVLVNMLNCLQGAFYVDLAERREKDEAFIYGWFKNRVKL